MNIEIQRQAPEPPESFLHQLETVGGKNPNGEPLFDVVWSEHRKAMVIMDGELRPLYHGNPCWLLRMWQDGEYVILQPLTLLEVVNGRLTIEVLPLTEFILQMVAIIRSHQDATHEERVATLLELKQIEEQRQVSRIEASIQSAHPAFSGNPFSGSGGLCTNTVQRKMELIERSMVHANKMYQAKGKGLSVN